MATTVKSNSNGIGVGRLLRYGHCIIGAACHDRDSDVSSCVTSDTRDFLFGQGGISRQPGRLPDGLHSGMTNEAFVRSRGRELLLRMRS